MTPEETSQAMYELQSDLPWGIHTYSQAFKDDPREHSHAAHAMLHIGKALGKIQRELRYQSDPKGPDRYLADLIYCAMRFANTFPDGDTIWISRAVSHWDVSAEAVCDPRDLLGNLVQCAGYFWERLDELDHGACRPTLSCPHVSMKHHLGFFAINVVRLGRSWPGRDIDVLAALRERVAEKYTGPDARAAYPRTP